MRTRIALLGSVIAIVLSCVTAAQAEVVTNEIFPVDEAFFVPCANDGAGETVAMSGKIHFVAHFTSNDNRISGMFFANTLNFSGIGQVTGDRYRRTGVSTSVFSESQQGSSFATTSVFSFQLVGQGAGNNLVVHTLFHVTVNAQGETTVSLDTLRADCK